MNDSHATTFDPWRLERQMAASFTLQWLLLGLVVGGWIAGAVPVLAETFWPSVAIFGGLGGWIFATVISSKTTRLAMRSSHLVAVDAPWTEAEQSLSEAISSFTLSRGIRVMIYHDLAMLRHKQRRFTESAAICATLLEHLRGGPSSPAGQMRPRLQLLLADACLQRGDVATAYQAMIDLYRRKLDLSQVIQLLDIQTRYQSLCGYHAAALARLPQKLAMSELMPVSHMARLHRLLAASAEMFGQTQTATYLTERANLLCEQSQEDDTIPLLAATMEPMTGALHQP